MKIFLPVLVLFLLAGCGESSVFEGLGDEGTSEARRAAAQKALDQADCNTAVNLFAGLFAEDSGNIDRRLDLSAAYLCQSGFSVQGLLSIIADFSKDKEGTKGTLLQKITGSVAAVIPDKKTWQDNICKSKDLLGDLEDDGKPDAWPCTSARDGQKNVKFFNNDPDAGYILTIVNLADATLAIADALNTLGGIAQCAKTETPTGCRITTEELKSVAASLVAAAKAASAAGSGGDLSQTSDNLVFNADTSPKDGTLSNEEILNYLVNQNIIKNPQDVTAEGCPFDPQQKKYICT